MSKLKSTETIGIFNVKTHLSALIQKVQRGKVFVITVRGKPIAQLQPYQEHEEQIKQALARLRQIRASVTGPIDIKEFIQAGRKY